MGGYRAKDADRERYVSLIEAAYVDGQLGDEDRELRVSRALGAETLDELEVLTRDLQRDPEPTPRPRVARPWAAVAGAVVAVGSLVATMLLLSAPDDPVADPAPVVVAEPPASSSPPPPPVETEVVVEEREVVPFEMTAAQVRRFLRRYEAKFGTLDTYGASFHTEAVFVEVPVRGSRPRYESWTWDGEWSRDSEARSATALGPIIDLGTIGVDRLMANIAMAERTLGVQRGTFSHAILNTWGDDPGPAINIHVGNTFQESGFLKTTVSGDRVLVRYPYEG